MIRKGPAKKVTIYVNEDTPYHLGPLYEAILTFLMSKGVAGAPATSTETIDAPSGRVTFRNGCARFCSWRTISVSARPSAVIIVVAVAHSA